MPPPMRLSRDLLVRGIIYKLQERAYADALTKAGEIEERLGNDRGQAMVLNSLGGVLQRLGKFPEAADALTKAGEIEERLGNDRGQAMVLNSLGGVLQRLGKFPEAADALERSTRNVSRSTMRQGLGAC
jgi:tetratricopeptide (TPR) repeat protein